MWKFKSPFIKRHPGRRRVVGKNVVFTVNMVSRIGTKSKLAAELRSFLHRPDV
jgi:hypothetical protein